jgi:hypothetical protein
MIWTISLTILLLFYIAIASVFLLLDVCLDGGFSGEGDGFNRFQKLQRVYHAFIWPWWVLRELLTILRNKLLAASHR